MYIAMLMWARRRVRELLLKVSKMVRLHLALENTNCIRRVAKAWKPRDEPPAR